MFLLHTHPIFSEISQTFSKRTDFCKDICIIRGKSRSLLIQVYWFGYPNTYDKKKEVGLGKNKVNKFVVGNQKV